MTLHCRPAARVGYISLLLVAALVSHASERTNRVSVIRVSTAGQVLKAQLGADGTIHLLLDSPDGPRYVKSQDDGRTFSEPIAVLDAASQRAHLGTTTIRRGVPTCSAGFQTCCIADFQVGRALEVVSPAGLETRDTADLEVCATVAVPRCAASQKPSLTFQAADLAIGKGGRVHVAMANNAWKLKLPEAEWGLYYTSLAPGAKAFSPVRNLNRKPSEGFSLAADEQGAVTACFLSGKLFTMNSHDNGETFTASAEPNPAWNPCDCCTTAAAYGRDGKLALLYREETDNERDMFVILSEQRSPSTPLRTRVSGTPWKLNGCPMTYFTITRADTGYVAAWPTKGQVYFARLDHAGAVLPPGEIGTAGTSGMRYGLLALSATDGATLIAWKNKDILGWQLYDAKGQTQGEPGSATSPGGGAAGIVMRSGSFLVFP